MKKLFYICTALAIVAAFAATPAVADDLPGFPKCKTFCDFCDAIQINGIDTSGKIDAEWHSWDCAGTNCPMMGKVGLSGVASPCPTSEDCRAAVRGLAADGCPGDFWWCIDSLDGSCDMLSGPAGGGTCWIDELCATIVDGPCDTGLAGLKPDKPSLLQTVLNK